MEIDTKQLLEEACKLENEIKELKLKYMDKMRTVLNEGFRNFFNCYPNIEAIAWNQYTPYFNDGEPCVFSANDPYLLTKKGLELFKDSDRDYAEEFEVIERDYDTDRKNKYETKTYLVQKEYVDEITLKEALEAKKHMDIMFECLTEEILENTFGDHAIIIATRDGFDVQRFAHD